MVHAGSYRPEPGPILKQKETAASKRSCKRVYFVRDATARERTVTGHTGHGTSVTVLKNSAGSSRYPLPKFGSAQMRRKSASVITSSISTSPCLFQNGMRKNVEQWPRKGIPSRISPKKGTKNGQKRKNSKTRHLDRFRHIFFMHVNWETHRHPIPEKKLQDNIFLARYGHAQKDAQAPETASPF